MGERWFQEKKSEGFYKRAKREGYRARSAYKLLQIQEKFTVVRKGDTIVDLGASPGGWAQVSAELVGETGRVFAIDLAHIRPIDRVVTMRGDLTKSETMEALRKEMAKTGSAVANVVVSDMSPDITGRYTMDQAQSAYLCIKALEFAEQVLDAGGNFVCKIFEGEDYPEYRKEVESKFERVWPYRPEATRRASSEVYLVCKGYRPRSR